MTATRSLITQSSAREVLGRLTPEFQKALGRAIPAEKFVRIALTSFQKTPGLLECSEVSILGSLMESAQMGLEPDGVHAALVPYKKTCKLMPMYQGLVHLAWNSGLIKKIKAEVVREKDDFAIDLSADDEITRHLPHWPTGEAGDLVAVYAIATMTNGGKPTVVMDRDQVIAIRDKSASTSSRDSPWNDKQAEPAMWKKTALRQLCKLLPKSPELRRALMLEDQAEAGIAQQLPAVNVEPVAVGLGTQEECDRYVARIKAAERQGDLHLLKEELDTIEWSAEHTDAMRTAYQAQMKEIPE